MVEHWPSMYKGLAPVPSTAQSRCGGACLSSQPMEREIEAVQVILSCMYIELECSLDYVEALDINKYVCARARACVCVCVCVCVYTGAHPRVASNWFCYREGL